MRRRQFISLTFHFECVSKKHSSSQKILATSLEVLVGLNCVSKLGWNLEYFWCCALLERIWDGYCDNSRRDGYGSDLVRMCDVTGKIGITSPGWMWRGCKEIFVSANWMTFQRSLQASNGVKSAVTTALYTSKSSVWLWKTNLVESDRGVPGKIYNSTALAWFIHSIQW